MTVSMSGVKVNTLLMYTLSYCANPFHHSTLSPRALCHADRRMSARLGNPLRPSAAMRPIFNADPPRDR